MEKENLDFNEPSGKGLKEAKEMKAKIFALEHNNRILCNLVTLLISKYGKNNELELSISELEKINDVYIMTSMEGNKLVVTSHKCIKQLKPNDAFYARCGGQ